MREPAAGPMWLLSARAPLARAASLMFVLAALIAGCTGPAGHPALDQAEAAVERARSAPRVRALAAAELDRAETALDYARAGARAGAPPDQVQHMAYIVSQQAALAEMRAAERVTRAEVGKLQRALGQGHAQGGLEQDGRARAPTGDHRRRRAVGQIRVEQDRQSWASAGRDRQASAPLREDLQGPVPVEEQEVRHEPAPVEENQQEQKAASAQDGQQVRIVLEEEQQEGTPVAEDRQEPARVQESRQAREPLDEVRHERAPAEEDQGRAAAQERRQARVRLGEVRHERAPVEEDQGSAAVQESQARVPLGEEQQERTPAREDQQESPLVQDGQQGPAPLDQGWQERAPGRRNQQGPALMQDGQQVRAPLDEGWQERAPLEQDQRGPTPRQEDQHARTVEPDNGAAILGPMPQDVTLSLAELPFAGAEPTNDTIEQLTALARRLLHEPEPNVFIEADFNLPDPEARTVMERRVEVVRAILVQRGVAPARLIVRPAGAGPASPADTSSVIAPPE